MEFIPDVERNCIKGNWHKGLKKIKAQDFEMISGAAYLEKKGDEDNKVHQQSNCDILFIMTPLESGWKIRMVAYTSAANTLKKFILAIARKSGKNEIEYI